ncbi:MAG: M28 family peptidase [candidate division WOR-3 bacterium]|nr:M28 family peptidase [candidate division WOR-3 bacterium]
MKKTNKNILIHIILIGLSGLFNLIVANNEFLVKISDRSQRIINILVSKNIPIVAEFSDALICRVTNYQFSQISLLNPIVLDTIDFSQDYYLVIFNKFDITSEIRKHSIIIDKGYSDDGYYLIIKTSTNNISELTKLPAQLVKLDFSPILISNVPPQYPEIEFNPLVQQMVNNVSQDTILSFLRRLQRFRTRYASTDSCRAAANWLKNKFLEYNCDSVYLHYFNINYAPNVVAIKRGYLYPDNIYVVICGHFDATSNQQPNFCPGADDNGSGTCAVLEAARVMRDYNFEYSIRYICFSAEEQGLIGSNAYAQQARAQGDSILAVLNFDMIGYTDINPEDLEIFGKHSNPNCSTLVNFFINCANMYTNLNVTRRMVSSFGGSDHHSFWQRGYVGLCAIEDYPLNNPHYHLTSDTIGAGFNNIEFCAGAIKAGVATLAELAHPINPSRPMIIYYSHRISEITGNNNYFWDPGESINLYITLRNLGQQPAYSVSATISTTEPFVTIIQNQAYYGTILPLDTTTNINSYILYASESTPISYNAQFSLTVTSNDTSWISTFSIPIGRFTSTQPIPDGPRYPTRYWAYDNTDTTYQECPTFSWLEIKNLGTRILFNHNDQVKIISLPPEFGSIRFYGRTYNTISVSVDGFIILGSDTTRAYNNSPIPSSSGPAPLIAVNWDDLVHSNTGNGGIWWYYNPVLRCLIVEWDSVSYYQASSIRDKFQVIIYDSTYTTPTLDNIIIAQYLTANRYTNSTIGIEDSSETIGIQYLFDGTYHPAAAQIVPGRAIKYTTCPPTGVYISEIINPSLYNTRNCKIIVSPNPFSHKTEIKLYPSSLISLNTPLKIYDTAGNLIKTIYQLPLIWDASDYKGEKVNEGVYFIIGKGITAKIVYLK